MKEYKARDKIVQKMTRDGLTEENKATGDVERVSKRDAELSFGKKRKPPPKGAAALSGGKIYISRSSPRRIR